MENKLTQTAAKFLAGKMNYYTCKEGLELKKMELGMEIIIINVLKLVIIFTLAVWLEVLWQTFVAYAAFATIKRYSFGLHALNSTACTLVSCCMFVIVPLLLINFGINNVGAIVAFSIILPVLYLYAPADTKARPLIGVKLRARFKRKAVICGFFVFIIALLIPSEPVKLLLTLGAAYQSIAIMPFMYKILKRSEKNYEAYEIT